MRGLCPLTSEEGIEVERCRGTTSLARIEGFPKRPQLSFAVLEQSQCGADDVARRPVAARGYLAFDKSGVMIIKAEGSVLAHDPMLPNIGIAMCQTLPSLTYVRNTSAGIALPEKISRTRLTLGRGVRSRVTGS